MMLWIARRVGDDFGNMYVCNGGVPFCYVEGCNLGDGGLRGVLVEGPERGPRASPRVRGTAWGGAWRVWASAALVLNNSISSGAKPQMLHLLGSMPTSSMRPPVNTCLCENGVARWSIWELRVWRPPKLFFLGGAMETAQCVLRDVWATGPVAPGSTQSSVRIPCRPCSTVVGRG